MRKLLVGAALAGAMAAPLGAQGAGDPITGGHGSFYFGPYVGYMIFGDFGEFSDGSESSADNGLSFGAQAGWSFTPNFSLLGNFAYNKTTSTIEPPGGGSIANSADIGVFLYDANLQFRLPFGQDQGWIAPFAQVGAGGIKYTFDTDDFQSEGRTNIAFNVGVGGDFQFMERVGARIMVKDYITSFNWRDVDSVEFSDGVDDTAHNFLLSFGLNFGF
jgi:hypothetical protein